MIREEMNPGIPSYVPHYKQPQDRTTYNGFGLPRTAGNQVPDPSWKVNTYREFNQQGSREPKGATSAEQMGHRNQGDSVQSEVPGTKNPTLKKLVLSKEEKSDLLEWSCSEPRGPVANRTERTSSQTNHDPGGETENKKSTFAILSNAIKRSFTKSISSAPESPKKSPHKAKPGPQGNYFDFPASIFRRGRSGFEYGANGTEMDCLSQRPGATRSAMTDRDEDVWGRGGSQKSQRDPNSVRLDDIPRMLANVSIRENDGAAAFRSRRNSLFSSLRLKSKTPEDPLRASSNETWSVFGSFRRKMSDKEPRAYPFVRAGEALVLSWGPRNPNTPPPYFCVVTQIWLLSPCLPSSGSDWVNGAPRINLVVPRGPDQLQQCVPPSRPSPSPWGQTGDGV
eukprot:XP_012817261.1 PREDICTED: uncharacterized protein LOC105947039 [Xenopus tropicalis]